MDWNLRTCARRGHATYAPDEPSLADRLRVGSPVGEAWRCLRCGSYVPGEPAGTGPAGSAPRVRRGRALRDLFVLRLLSVERIVRGLLILLLSYAVLRFRDSQADLRQLFERDLPAARPLADRLHVDLDDSGVVHSIRHALTVSSTTLTVVTALLAGYALIEIVEGVGLWIAARWAEYLTVVATAVFLPLEAFELTEKVSALRIGALVFNLAAVVYLLVTKRLFGLRGGRAGIEARHAAESLLEIELAGG
ncbi:MAG TPA: DUF2127 domain-containing protein [Mycobacteriales bacterium]|nr:DUF2127 domain-containing protein [Mycobacteriales bacterium]